MFEWQATWVRCGASWIARTTIAFARLIHPFSSACEHSFLVVIHESFRNARPSGREGATRMVPFAHVSQREERSDRVLCILAVRKNKEEREMRSSSNGRLARARSHAQIPRRGNRPPRPTSQAGCAGAPPHRARWDCSPCPGGSSRTRESQSCDRGRRTFALSR